MTETSAMHTFKLVMQLAVVVGAFALVGLALWRADVEALVEGAGAAGPLSFFAAVAVLPALGVPTTPLFLLAGAAFGVLYGLLGTIAAMTLNLALTYWLARGYLRRTIESLLLVRFRYSLPNLSRVGAWRFTLLVKLAPGAPTFVKNYLVGIAGVPPKVYFGIMWPLTMLYAAGVILLGDSLHDRDWSMTIIAAVALLLLLVALKLLRRWEREDPPPAPPEADDELVSDPEMADDPERPRERNDASG